MSDLDIKQYRYLIQCGARVDITNKLGETPLHKLCSYSNDTKQRSKAVNICIKSSKLTERIINYQISDKLLIIRNKLLIISDKLLIISELFKNNL